jgi:putative transcriptional regulator
LIKCNLSTILGSKRMTRTKLLRKSGISLTSLKPFYDDTWKGIRRETLDALCKALDCDVSDLITFENSEDRKG